MIPWGASVLSADSFYAGLGVEGVQASADLSADASTHFVTGGVYKTSCFSKKAKKTSAGEVLFLAAESASVLLCGWPWKGTSVWCHCLLKQITQLATVLLMLNYQKISRLGPS